jgi:hypothetical protein
LEEDAIHELLEHIIYYSYVDTSAEWTFFEVLDVWNDPGWVSVTIYGMLDVNHGILDMPNSELLFLRNDCSNRVLSSLFQVKWYNGYYRIKANIKFRTLTLLLLKVQPASCVNSAQDENTLGF